LVSGPGRVDLPTVVMTDFHPSLTDNMVQNREEQLNPNIQFPDPFHAKEVWKRWEE